MYQAGKIISAIAAAFILAMPGCKAENNSNKEGAKMTASIAEAAVTRSDSPRNCAIRPDLFAPDTFLTPTSLALFTDLAVARFM